MKGYVCRSKNSDTVTIAVSTGIFKTPDIKKETGWFRHVPGCFYTMSVWAFKRQFGFSVKPGAFKQINILISEG